LIEEKKEKEVEETRKVDLAEKVRKDLEESSRLNLPTERQAPANEPTAPELLEKGRELCRTKEFALAETSFSNAMLKCGDATEDELLKAELYLRLAIVREAIQNMNRYSDPFSPGKIKKGESKSAWVDDISRAQFRKIMLDQGKTKQEISVKHLAITQDHRALVRRQPK
jgi:hypothetical protein